MRSPGSPEFSASVEKAEKFKFRERGELSKTEKGLSNLLGSEIDADRINPGEFIGRSFADKNIVQDDQRRVQEMQQKIEADYKHLLSADPEKAYAQDRGELSERVMIQAAKRGGLFGKKAKIAAASFYDDYFNGVDCIAEFDDMHQVAIGIDTTLGKDMIVQKLKRIRDSIQKGKLAEVKYYKSGDTLGTLENVPLTIVGISPKANAELAELVYDLEAREDVSGGENSVKTEKNLLEHDSQYTGLFEIALELQVFASFAQKQGAAGLAEKIKNTLSRVHEKIKEKTKGDKKLRDEKLAMAKKDELFQIIAQTLSTHFTNWKEPEIVAAKIPKNPQPRRAPPIKPSWKR